MRSPLLDDPAWLAAQLEAGRTSADIVRELRCPDSKVSAALHVVAHAIPRA